MLLDVFDVLVLFIDFDFSCECAGAEVTLKEHPVKGPSGSINGDDVECFDDDAWDEDFLDDFDAFDLDCFRLIEESSLPPQRNMGIESV